MEQSILPMFCVLQVPIQALVQILPIFWFLQVLVQALVQIVPMFCGFTGPSSGSSVESTHVLCS